MRMPDPMRVSLIRLLGAVLLAHLSPGVSANALENAYFVCDVFEKTGISTECQIAHVSQEIEVRVDTSEEEARNICGVIVNRLQQKKRYFGTGWKLRIMSPKQAHTPLAECALR